MDVSAHSFFTVLMAYEGLSMWKSLTRIPRWRRLQQFKEKWERRFNDSDKPILMAEVLSCAKERILLSSMMGGAVFVRWTPPLIALLAVLLYSGCAIVGVPTAVFFHSYHKGFCWAAILIATLQFVLVIVTSRFFDDFDAETLVSDDTLSSSKFSLAKPE